MAVEFSIGMVEVSGLGDAILMLDDMCKAADVEFCATERKLGGRLVTIVVKGELTAVSAAVDAGVTLAKSLGSYKASQIIARPHNRFLKTCCSMTINIMAGNMLHFKTIKQFFTAITHKAVIH